MANFGVTIKREGKQELEFSHNDYRVVAAFVTQDVELLGKFQGNDKLLYTVDGQARSPRGLIEDAYDQAGESFTSVIY